MILRILLAVIGLVPVIAMGETAGDVTLGYYMANSELVVAGTVSSEPGVTMTNPRFRNYHFDFAISEVLHGRHAPTDTIRVTVPRHEAGPEDALPYMKKGSQCILFLKRVKSAPEQFVAADVWFGVQRYNSRMALFIKNLSQDMNGKREEDSTNTQQGDGTLRR